MRYLAAAGQPDPLIPSVPELIIGFVAFAIVFAILYKILMPRITRTLEERTDAIEGGLKRADESQAEAAKMLDQYRAQLADARHEAARLREEAREEAAQIIAQSRAEGAAERQRLIDSAAAQIAADRQQALTALRAEMGALSVELASRVVGEALQEEARQRGMVDRFLAEIETSGAGVRAGR